MRRITGLLFGVALVGLVVPGGGANAAPTCFSKVATIVGTSGDDYLRGTSGDDVIVGLGGDDGIDGVGGNDLICGNGGNDSGDYADDGGLTGGSGGDKISGGRGNDSLSGYCKNIDDSPGFDERNKLYGGSGNDTVADGCTWHDYLSPGGETNDYLSGGPGNDTLLSTYGDDKLFGRGGRDRLGFSYQFSDSAVDDTDYGIDVYHGGAGNDRLDAQDHIIANDSVYGDGGRFDQCDMDNQDYQDASCDD